MFRFGNSELPVNIFLVDLDSYPLSKTTRFAQRELLRWAKYHRLLIALVLDLFIFQFRKNSMNLKIKTMSQSIPRLFMFSMIKSKILLPLVAVLLSISSNVNAASSCPNVQVGAIISGSINAPAIYSDCSMDVGSATEYWLTMYSVNNSIRVTGWPSGNSAFSPPAAGPTEFGTFDGLTLYAQDMGASYSGDCTELSSSISSSISAIVGNTYCGVIGNTNGRKVWFRGTWTGSTFTNPSVLTDEPSVVTLSTPPTPAAIPTLSEWAMLLMASLMGLFAFTRIRRQS